MAHYIDAEKLKERVTRLIASAKQNDWPIAEDYLRRVIDIIDSLQQDEKAVELDMCSQAYWEERGWMMIPPDVTLKGIESLLEQVRKKLQQEQPQVADASKMDLVVDLEKELDRYLRGEFQQTAGGNFNNYIQVARHFYGLRNRALEEAARHVYESWMGGTMDDVRRDMVTLGTVLNARKEDK